MKPHIQKLKAELKALAKTIIKTKEQFKEAQRTSQSIWPVASELGKAQHDFRHKHIVRCLLRGTPREKIEQPKEQNKPDEKYIEKLMAGVLSEALCPNQGGSIEESASSTGGACPGGVLPEASQEPMERDTGVLKVSDPRNAPRLINRLTEFLRGCRIS